MVGGLKESPTERVHFTEFLRRGFQTPALILRPLKNLDLATKSKTLILHLKLRFSMRGTPSTIPTKRQAAARKTELGAWSMFGQVSVLRPRVAQRCLEPHSSQSVSSRALEILCHSQSVRTLLVMFKGWERGKKVSLSFRSCHMSHLLDIVQ